MLKAVDMTSRFGNIFNQKTVSLMMRIYVNSGHFDDAFFLYQKHVDTIPPPPIPLIDHVPDIVPLVPPNTEICNLAIQSLLSPGQGEEEERRQYALAIFRRMVRSSDHAEKTADLAERIRDVYWGVERQIDIKDLLAEIMTILAESHVVPYPTKITRTHMPHSLSQQKIELILSLLYVLSANQGGFFQDLDGRENTDQYDCRVL